MFHKYFNIQFYFFLMHCFRGGLEDRPGLPRSAKPNGRQTHEQTLQVTDSGYQSGSHDLDLSSKRPSMTRKMGPSSTTAKFCHDCGTPYLSSQVKFCTECGLKRLDVSARWLVHTLSMKKIPYHIICLVFCWNERFLLLFPFQFFFNLLIISDVFFFSLWS